MRLLFTLCFLTLLCTCVIAQNDVRISESVYFASAGHEPSEAELEKLADFATTLSSYASYTLKIEAFTDEKGTETYNEALAKRRAAAITAALARQSVVPTTSEVLSYGEQRARQNTTDDSERQNDRRVDLVATVTHWESADMAIKQARAEQLQSFTIDDPTVRQTVRGDQGGVFIIDPNSLVGPDGKLVNGPVTIELIEAYDLSDMLIAGLTTTSGNRPLETGGMIKLTATDAAGRELQLKEGAKLASSIPTQNFNEQMKLFVGAGHDEAGTPTDWTLTGRGLQSSATRLFPLPASTKTYEEFQKEVKGQVDYLAEVVDRTDLRPDILKHRAGINYLSWLRSNPRPKTPEYQDPATYRLRKKPELIDTSEIVYKPRGSEKIFMSAKRRAALTHQQRLQAQKRYDRQQKHYLNSVTYRDNLPALNEKKRLDFEAKSAEFEGELQRQKEIVMGQVSREMFAIFEARRKAYEKYRSMKMKELEESLVSANDLTGQESGLQRYFFNLTNLGWANCDMFYDEEELVQVLASLPESDQKAQVMLLPDDRRSVIPYGYREGGTWVNPGIPRDLSYQVIAYQVRNGQLVMAHKKVGAAQAESAEILEYKPVAVAELRARLAELVGS